jgi:LmbE family N-acetylglucosaminyl deacetylase
MRFVGSGLLTLATGFASLRPDGVPRPVRYQPNTILDFVVVAHQDDWQLFMGDAIERRAAEGDSITFVYLTAGDDGREPAYWQTRERAALAATRAAIGAQAGEPAARCSITVVSSHLITGCTSGRTVSYFLRLPDGQRNGAGFARYGNQSLRKLRAHTIGSITAVDGSATYDGWDDVLGTVTQLLHASGRAGSVSVHTTDPSVRVNPHDHFDHRMAGLLVADARKSRRWTAWYYVGYALGTRAPNRSGDQAREKTALFRAYDAEMIRANPKWSAYAEHPRFYSECMVRTYARQVPGVRNR